MRRLPLWTFAAALCLPLVAQAESVTVDLSTVSADGVGEKIGTARLSDHEDGLRIVVDIDGGSLSDGLHGFHMHQNPSCEPARKDGETTAAAAAGGHFDPQDTGDHRGPSGTGHLGDLPVI